MARVTSVNVGVPREVTWNRQTFTTAIRKSPVAGRVAVVGVNIAGDDQADRSVHGGISKAVYGYASEDYAWFRAEHGIAVEPGLFGENLTTEGIDLGACLIGERWRVGSALLEISEPRIPCYKLNYRMNDPRFGKRFGAALRPGSYFRIIEEGDVASGDAIVREGSPQSDSISVREVMRIFLFAHEERDKLIHVEALSLNWRGWAQQ